MKKLLAMLLALMLTVSMLTVAVFADTTTNDADDEGGDTANVGDTENEAPEKNPHTGLALAALPIVVSAAAVAVSKKH